MLKELLKFQRVLGYPAAFSANTPPKHVGKIIIVFFVLCIVFSIYFDFLSPALTMVFVLVVSCYSSINKSFSLWRLFPISYKKSINYIYATMFLTIVLAIMFVIFLSSVGLTIFYFVSTPSEFNSIEGLPSFLEFINAIFSVNGFIVFFICCILINLALPLCFLKNLKEKVIGFSVMLGVVLGVGAAFKYTYDFTLSEHLYYTMDFNTKLIVLCISLVLFAFTLFFSNKLSKSIYISRFLKV